MYRTIRTRALVALAAGTLAVTTVVAGSAQAEPTVTRDDVEKAFHQAEAANETLNQLAEDAKELDARIDELTSEIDTIHEAYTVQRDELGAAIVQQQLEQPLGPTVSLLASDDPDLFIDGLSAIDALNTTRADALETFSATSKQLKNRQKQLDEQHDELAKAKAKATKTKESMEAAYQKARLDFALLSAGDQAEMNASDTSSVANAGKGAAKTAIAFALAQLGDPYVYGGTGPNGWDCSGLVMKAYAAAGVSLPRVVGPQMAAVRKVSKSELQPGDLVAYPSMAHIGIYLGGGRVVHAPRPGKSVEITNINAGFGVYGRVG